MCLSAVVRAELLGVDAGADRAVGAAAEPAGRVRGESGLQFADECEG